MTARTPDFAEYPAAPGVVAAHQYERWVEVEWSDGETARFHHIWLADNAADDEAIDPHSREKLVDICDLPADIAPLHVSVTDAGALTVVWSPGHRSHYHPGWLRAHRYDGAPDCFGASEHDPLERRLWDASADSELPVFGWSAVEDDPDARLAFLTSVRSFGLALLTDGPTTAADFQRRIQDIVLIRNMNWGMFFDVVYEPDGKYISNKGVNIVPHVDAPTREYMVGLMCFHCLANTVSGGDSYWVDGYQVAQRLREEDPEAYRLLTTIPWRTGNRSPDTAYQHDAPIVCLDRHGNPGDIRDIHWLREPLIADFDLIEPMYRAYRAWSQLTRDPANQIRRRLEPSQTAISDNRRVLHARTTYDEAAGGRRHMHACYSEREELDSAIRLLTRR